MFKLSWNNVRRITQSYQVITWKINALVSTDNKIKKHKLSGDKFKNHNPNKELIEQYI